MTADGAGHLAKFLLTDPFPASQAIGFVRHRIQTAVGMLLLRATKQIGGFAQAVGGAARFGAARLRRGACRHWLRLQTIEGLLHARIGRPCWPIAPPDRIVPTARIDRIGLIGRIDRTGPIWPCYWPF